MLDQNQMARIFRILPNFREVDPQIANEFQRNAYFARIPSGRDIFSQGDQVNAIALLMDGTVRVYIIGQSGREITLYRFGGGQSCVLTAHSILNHRSFSAIASVEQDAEGIMIPADIFRDWVRRYDFWRDFVFNLLAARLANIMEILDEVAFGRLDIRVASLLLEKSDRQEPLRITHQEIAAELGSSREVISRVLGNFAHLEIIRMSRGKVEILDYDQLATYTQT